MNYDETLKKMIEGAAAAAKIHWKDFQTYAEEEFKNSLKRARGSSRITLPMWQPRSFKRMPPSATS
jgi:hypothetical protein